MSVLSMQTPANVVAGTLHLPWAGLNILGAGINTAGFLGWLLADTGNDLLDTLKTPLKGATWKAIGNRYKARINTFTTHQKAKLKEYLEPFRLKNSKRDNINQLAKWGGKLTHIATAGAITWIVNALDSGWSRVKGISNIFRKKEKKIDFLWKFKERKEKRRAEYKKGIDKFDQVSARSNDVKNKTKETEQDPGVLEQEADTDPGVNSEETVPEQKVEEKKQTEDKNKKVEENKKEGQKNDTKEKRKEKNGEEKSEKTSENKNKKTELEKIEEKKFEERERQYENNKEFIKESEAIIKDFEKTLKVEEPEWGAEIRKNIIKALKESKWMMTEESIEEYKKYEDLFRKAAKENGKEYLKNNEWKITTLLWFYKILIFLSSTEEDYLYQCFMDVQGALYYKFKNSNTPNTEKQHYRKLLQKFDTLRGKVFPKKSK